MDFDRKVVDYEIIEANDEFCRMVGKEKVDVVGKKASEVFGSLEDNMLDEFGKVALGGEVIRLKNKCLTTKINGSAVWFIQTKKNILHLYAPISVRRKEPSVK
jgi:PAS domain-containing protein